MKGTDRAVLLGVLMAALLGAFYFMVLSPKRSEVSELDKQVKQLESSISEQEQVAAFAEQARQEYPVYYGRLVVLGKAVPDQADTASLLVQLSRLSQRTDVDFQGLKVSSSGGSTATAPTAAPPTTAPAAGTSTAPTTAASTDPSSSGTTTPTTTAAPATEASAANLPIGAKVGSAGLPTLPYDLTFRGTFFDTASFLSGVDDLVHLNDALVVANGRLMTVDGFALSEPTLGPNPELQVNLALTSYVTPSDQGLTAGATPGGPAPSVGGTAPTQPASATVTP